MLFTITRARHFPTPLWLLILVLQRVDWTQDGAMERLDIHMDCLPVLLDFDPIKMGWRQSGLFEVFPPALFDECLPSCHSTSVFCLSLRPSLPPNFLFSDCRWFRSCLFLELRHGECSLCLARGLALLMIFGSLAPLCSCIGPLQAGASGTYAL